MESTPPAERETHDAHRSDLVQIPEAVDWVVGAIVVLVGLASALAGTALLFAIDRSEIREGVADGDVQSDLLSDAQIVDVTQATATWSGVGLVATGAILFLAGLGYVLLRHRAHGRAADGVPVRGRWTNAILGAIVTAVLSFLPFSPALGGLVAGYLERGNSERVVGVGALSGVLAVAPLLAVAAFALGGVAAGLLDVGEDGLAVVVVAALLFTAAVTATIGAGLGAIGGYAGGALAARDVDDGGSPDASA